VSCRALHHRTLIGNPILEVEHTDQRDMHMATISGQNLIQAEKTYVVVIKRSEIEPCYSLSSPQFAYGVQPHKQIEGMKGIMSGS